MSLIQVAKCLVTVGFVSVKLMLIIGDPNHNGWSRKGEGMDFIVPSSQRLSLLG